MLVGCSKNEKSTFHLNSVFIISLRLVNVIVPRINMEIQAIQMQQAMKL